MLSNRDFALPIHFEPLSVPIFISLIMTALLGVMAYLRRKDNPLAELFSALMFTASIWSFCYFMGLSSQTVEGKYFWLKAKYFGSATAPVINFLFAMKFTNNTKVSESRGFHLILSVITAVFILIAITNDHHQLFWTKVWIEPGFPEELVIHNIGFYTYFVFTYLLVIFTSLAYFRYLIQSKGLFKRQAFMMAAGSLFPLFGSISYAVFGLDLVPKLDETIFTFLISGLIFSIAIFRFHTLKIIPIAHRLILDRLKEGIIVTNEEKQILEINPSAENIFSLDPEICIGQDAMDIFDKWPELLHYKSDEEETETEITIYKGEDTKYYLVNRTPLADVRNRIIGHVCVVKDITSLKSTELELQHLATHDSLTGLFNRRQFYELADREFARADRYGHSLGLMICDIDHFKQINDTYGHIVGDEVLKSFSKLSSSNLRKTDIFARFGGEEFVILMPEISKADLLMTGEKIRKLIEEAVFENDGNSIQFSLSIGLFLREENDSVNLLECIRRADQALYVSKESGRNLSTLWEENLSTNKVISKQSGQTMNS